MSAFKAQQILVGEDVKKIEVFPSNPDFQKHCSLAKTFENGCRIGCSEVLIEHLMIIKQKPTLPLCTF